MQLALTTQTWCDFVFYASKELVIDRVFYDKEHWGKLQKSIMKLLQHKITYSLTHNQVLKMQPFLKIFQLNLSQVYLSQSKPVKLIANILTYFSTVLSLCRDQLINLHCKSVRRFLYDGILPQGFKNLHKSLEGRGGSKIHNMA